MVKFVIEVSEEYVRKKSNLDNAQEMIRKGEEAFKTAYDMLTFTGIKTCLDEGLNEFHIKRDDLDEESVRILDSVMGHVCMVAYASKRLDDKFNSGNQQEEKESER